VGVHVVAVGRQGSRQVSVRFGATATVPVLVAGPVQRGLVAVVRETAGVRRHCSNRGASGCARAAVT
jgi:hypothetical protein